jgi:hypothetical protein
MAGEHKKFDVKDTVLGELRKRLGKLEEQIYPLPACVDEISRILGRVHKLEKTKRPIIEPSVQMTTEKLQDIAERYEVELRRMLGFMETQILYEFVEHMKRVKGNADVESVKYFLRWVTKWSRYEIKRKKK